MKKILVLSVALALLGGAATAQVMQDLGGDTGIFGPGSTRMDGRSRVINVYFEEGSNGTSQDLAAKILKELETSQYFDFVATPTDVTRIIAPTKVTVPANNKGAMKVGFQMAFPRGSEQDYTVSCDVGKPQDCARAIRLRAERLYRDYLEVPPGG